MSTILPPHVQGALSGVCTSNVTAQYTESQNPNVRPGT